MDKAALLQHSKHAAYQVGVWTSSQVQRVGAGVDTMKSCLFGLLYHLLATLALNYNGCGARCGCKKAI